MAQALRVFAYVVIVVAVFYATYPKEESQPVNQNSNQPAAAARTSLTRVHTPANVDPSLQQDRYEVRPDDALLSDSVFNHPAVEDGSEQPGRVARSLSEFVQQAVASETPLPIEGLELSDEAETFDVSEYLENDE